jgi:hypothetical protein
MMKKIRLESNFLKPLESSLRLGKQISLGCNLTFIVKSTLKNFLTLKAGSQTDPAVVTVVLVKKSRGRSNPVFISGPNKHIPK